MSFFASVNAAEISYSYNSDNLPSHGIGFDKAETYDVAILIDEPSLKGSSIKGISVALPGGDNVSGCFGWLTNELKLKRENGKYVNDPDIMLAEGMLTEGTLNLTFPESYTIDGPIYAGYTFTVNELTESTGEPVMVADGVNEDGLFIHSSRSKLKWNSYSSEAGGVSVMKVIIEGDFTDNAASFNIPKDIICSAEDPAVVITASVANHGLNPIEKVAYTYEIADLSGEGEYTFPSPIPPTWGDSCEMPIELGQISEEGTYDLILNITAVNGVANNDLAPVSVESVKVLPFMPVSRPIVEEYTGLWCGWCPKGYVALETMHEEYPDRFIGVAYHSGDPMSYAGSKPNSPDGFPAGYINRTSVDLGNIYTIWPRYANTFVNADIDVKIDWTDDSQTSLKATSTVRFVEDMTKADYGISYLLLIDGLSDPIWVQSNYYAPKEGEEPIDYPSMPGKWGELFTHGKEKMVGLVYNDVILDGKYNDGFPGSIPSTITANERITHSCVFNLEELDKPELVQDKNKLRVVAVIIDRKKAKPVNCNTSAYPDGSTNGADMKEAAASEVVSSEWYNLQGVRIENAAKGMGLLIRIDYLSDGSITSTKQVF